ncbi:MAG TPA: uracil-DNA glycosylase [Porticoccaceae bacterium]|nr:uracil-DNA glycosylase [Porticoccaceae bacterium]
MKQTTKSGPDCWACVYFKITHDRHRPYGCDAMGFKSKALPSIEVIKAHGEHCLSFFPKQRKL